MKRKVIIVTDGDDIAKRAVEIAAKNIGGRSISRSSGNPTPLTSYEVINFIKQAANDPVVVMVDDCGDPGRGTGEIILKAIVEHSDIEVLGVVAVASNTKDEEGVDVDESVSKEGKFVNKAVDKSGAEKGNNRMIGDTLSILSELNIPVIIGLGDPGKMGYKDDIEKGAPLTTKALQRVIENSGYKLN